MDRQPTITDMLYALQPGETRVFKDELPDTLRRVATRLQERYERKYTCRSTPDGYQVWRTA